MCGEGTHRLVHPEATPRMVEESRKMVLFIILVLLLLSTPLPVHAVCPVCTIAVGVGVGLSRYLGIDDTVSGIWIGGLIVSSGFWLASYLSKKKINLPYKKVISVALFYLFVVPPLYLTGIMGHVYNTLWGIDKLLVGMTVGTILFIAGVASDKYLRSKNRGKVYFYYQKVILPVTFLLIGSLIFYFITKY